MGILERASLLGIFIYMYEVTIDAQEKERKHLNLMM